MRTFQRHSLLALMLCLMLAVSACGQKGDLYLPEGNLQSVMAG
ncbi:LPS translocon maturation chaperone LptM [Methylophaga sp. OBS1]|jgi:predicted small lipoprotein YifL|nr:lipoprotein [Methylophaga sp. OBS1]MCX4193762.1 lipoprotein [Methylophaga sp. OBS1]